MNAKKIREILQKHFEKEITITNMQFSFGEVSKLRVLFLEDNSQNSFTVSIKDGVVKFYAGSEWKVTLIMDLSTLCEDLIKKELK